MVSNLTPSTLAHPAETASMPPLAQTEDGPVTASTEPVAEPAISEAIDPVNWFIRNAPVVTWALDHQGIFTFSDGASLRKAGMQPGQIVGKSVFDLYAGNASVLDAVRRALAGEQIQTTAKVGNIFYQTVFEPIPDQKTNTVGVVGVSFDITERLAAEAALQETAEKFNVAMEGAKLGMWDWNLVTNEVLYNDQWMVMLGYEPGEWPNTFDTFASLVHPEDTPRITNIINTYLAGEIPDYNAEMRLRRKDGGFHWVLTSGKIFARDAAGKPLRLVGIHIDINERKEAEKERERLIRTLRETSRYKDEFLATMSHELRTPLNAMIGLLGIVLMGNRLNDTDRNMVTRARANSERLLTLINNILDISRMEAGRLEIVPTNVDVRALALKVQSDLRVLADQKKLAFVLDINPSVPETVRIDEDALNKILVNLVGNAIKFTERGQVKLLIDLPDGVLRIAVSDTGIGIPAHQREIIFETFRQVDSSSTRAYGGSGLGLSIIRRLVAAMHGTIRLDSEVGVGSTFTVQLPTETPVSPVSLQTPTSTEPIQAA
jgi:PAS domain S-box-containing protein